MVEDQRQNSDRRKKPTRLFSRYSFIGRRKQARRKEEAVNYYVDRYAWHYVVVIGLILIFCGMDAYLSLKIFEFGGTEANVLMRTLLKRSLIFSLAAKFVITTVCAIFLLIHKNFKLFNRIKTHALLYSVFGIYLILILFEVYTVRVLRGL